MLKTLSIDQFRLIDSAKLEFHPGMNVITGETGSGKSIMLRALALVTGARADKDDVREGSNKCVIELELTLPTSFESWFTSRDLDYYSETILRREVTSNGRSRSFINDTPVGLKELQNLGKAFVHVHGQHETLALFDPKLQREMVDLGFAHESKVQEYHVQYTKYVELKKALKDLLDKRDSLEALLESRQRDLESIHESGILEENLAELESRFTILSNAEVLHSVTEEARNLLEGADASIIQHLAQVIQQLDSVAKHDEELSSLVARLRSSQIEIQDCSSSLEDLSESYQFSPEEYEKVSQALDTSHRFLKKYQCSDIEELKVLVTSWEEELHNQGLFEINIKKYSTQIDDLGISMNVLAQTIHKGRVKASAERSAALVSRLKTLSMPKARVVFGLEEREDFGPFGKNAFTWLFSANPGFEVKPIEQVASGGERSRFMLAVRSILGQAHGLSTLIFDEIDTGVSGKVADQIGLELLAIAQHQQVITITHLPVIAARANKHYLVEKAMDDHSTWTTIEEVEGKARTSAVASLIGNHRDTKVLEVAESLLSEGSKQ
ncbi:MAG: DNA repair protein RecN [Bacteroidota bacterium]|nr:DNA repair protein RecN [Bacteroidota bacterium]